MLEGQVAALSSGLVGPSEATDLLASLYASPLYRPDQDSFLLYREKTLPTFLERNVIPDAKALGVPLVGELLPRGIPRSSSATPTVRCAFMETSATAHDLEAALDRLQLRRAVTHSAARDRRALIDLFVEVFGHRMFTGRSGTMYAYEGLGSIYWHMVSKLLLAVQEVALGAYRSGGDARICAALARDYYRIRGGLGVEKSVRDYGAFPTDPYSHTPRHAGAQQPGMTGQVKEEILTRFGELGVHVQDGIVGFDPCC